MSRKCCVRGCMRSSRAQAIRRTLLSTTHVRLEVMSRFNKNLPDYTYRRVSTKPLNPRNKAYSLHEGKIAYFQEDRNRKSHTLRYLIGSRWPERRVSHPLPEQHSV
ncbi:c-type heme family protein [Candidatus Hakubella thermalkaliphila]|uniref:c-type heme family protein n=1 Tax=Candidatus Hakubella thermalkaliphila TaxID=2754717 RepID=UPI00387E6A4D